MTNLHIDYDPDFDEEQKPVEEKIAPHGVQSKIAFFAGLGSSILIVSTIGFIILLTILLRSS